MAGGTATAPPSAEHGEPSVREKLRELDAGAATHPQADHAMGRYVLRRFFHNKAAMVSLGILIALLLYATFGPYHQPVRLLRPGLLHRPPAAELASTGSAPTCSGATCSCG